MIGGALRNGVVLQIINYRRCIGNRCFGSTAGAADVFHYLPYAYVVKIRVGTGLYIIGARDTCVAHNSGATTRFDLGARAFILEVMYVVCSHLVA